MPNLADELDRVAQSLHEAGGTSTLEDRLNATRFDWVHDVREGLERYKTLVGREVKVRMGTLTWDIRYKEGSVGPWNLTFTFTSEGGCFIESDSGVRERIRDFASLKPDRLAYQIMNILIGG